MGYWSYNPAAPAAAQLAAVHKVLVQDTCAIQASEPMAAEPAVMAVETWTHADVANSLTADQTWTFFGGGTDWGIVSNQAKVSGIVDGSGFGDNARMELDLDATIFQQVQCVLVSLTGITLGKFASFGIKIQVAASGSDPDNYSAYYTIASDGTTNVNLWKRVSGVSTQLGANVAATAVGNDNLRLTLDPGTTTLNLLFNNAVKITQVDSAITANTRTGLEAQGNDAGMAMIADTFQAWSMAATSVVTKSATDSCAVQASDATPGPHVATPADTCVVQVSDAVPGPHVAVPFDTAVVQLSDPVPAITAIYTAADTCQVQAVDDTPGPHVATPADTAVVQAVDDTPTRGAVAVQDSLTIQLADATTNNLLSLVADTCVIQLVDATPVPAAIVPATDTAQIQASDIGSSVLVPGAIVDTAVVQISDAIPGPHAATPSDSLTVQLTDLTTNALFSSVADTLPIVLVDATPSPSAVLQATDSAAIQAVDTVPGPLVLSPSDALPILASDAGVSILVPGAVTDACAVQLDDTIPGPHLALPADIAAIQASDSPTVLVILSVADSLAILVAEAVSPGPQLLSVQDALTLGMQDIFTPGPLALLVADSLGLTLDDQQNLFARLSTTDTLPVQADDVGFANTGVSIGVPASDSCVVGLLDVATVTATEKVHVWGGGARIEDAHFIYPTSVRVGPLPPDQSRGGTW